MWDTPELRGTPGDTLHLLFTHCQLSNEPHFGHRGVSGKQKADELSLSREASETIFVGPETSIAVSFSTFQKNHIIQWKTNFRKPLAFT